MKPYAFIAVLLLVLAAATPAPAEGLALTFKTATSGLNGNVTTTEETVTLYPDSFIIKNGGKEAIYDFVSKRAYETDISGRTYQSYPLCLYPIALGAEKLNRLLLNKSLRAKGSPESPLIESDIDIDMRFGSLSNTKTAGDIQKSEADGTTTFTVGGRGVAHYTLSATAIPADLKKSYGHFIVYALHTHPSIKQAVSGTDKFFNTLHYTVKNSDQTFTNDWTLTGAQPAPAAPALPPAGYSPVYSSDPVMDKTMKKALNDKKPTPKAVEDKIKAYTAKKDDLRAFLTTMEALLIFPADKVEKTEAFKAALKKSSQDEKLKNLFEAIALRPKTPANFEKMAETLDGAKAAAPDFSYLVDFYKANQVVSWTRGKLPIPAGDIPDVPTALKKIEAAIIANPFLTASYLEAGDISFKAWHMKDAWNYWDQALRLAPDHPSLKPVHSMMQRAEKDFPEYF